MYINKREGGETISQLLSEESSFVMKFLLKKAPKSIARRREGEEGGRGGTHFP